MTCSLALNAGSLGSPCLTCLWTRSSLGGRVLTWKAGSPISSELLKTEFPETFSIEFYTFSHYLFRWTLQKEESREWRGRGWLKHKTCTHYKYGFQLLALKQWWNDLGLKWGTEFLLHNPSCGFKMFGSKSVTLENPLFPGETILVTVCAVSWVFFVRASIAQESSLETQRFVTCRMGLTSSNPQNNSKGCCCSHITDMEAKLELKTSNQSFFFSSLKKKAFLRQGSGTYLHSHHTAEQVYYWS